MAKTAYLFPGQGSQFVGMGKELYEASPAARDIFDRADEKLGFSLSKLCFNGSTEELKQTINAQPALLTMSCACLAAAKEIAGDRLPEADYAAGHSLGEYTALTAVGGIDFETAVYLARERGRLMYDAGVKVPGTMAAVIALAGEEVKKVCKETGTYIANLNCPGQIVISGESERVQSAAKLAKERGAKLVLPLEVSGAFHSPLMASAVEEMDRLLAEAEIRQTRAPVIGNTTATPLRTVEAVRAELHNQLCGCVRWEETLRCLADKGVTEFIEIGPGKVLSGLVKRTVQDATTRNLGDLQSITVL